MPILKQEIDLYPNNLFESDRAHQGTWWAMYTLSRQEKKLMRELHKLEIPYYGPTIGKRYRAANGRLRTSNVPLFSNYVFLCGEESDRYKAICTGTISRCMAIADPETFVHDLQQIKKLIETDAPLTPERRIEPGEKVRVKSGSFKGFEGVVLRRENEVRLLIYVRYMGQGASVALDDCQLESLESRV